MVIKTESIFISISLIITTVVVCSETVLSFLFLDPSAKSNNRHSDSKTNLRNISNETKGDSFTIKPMSSSIKLFILAGQSNMVGAASNLNDLLPSQLEPQHQVLWYDKNNQWVELQPPTEPMPFTRRVFNGEGFGPEISIGLQLATHLNETVALIKYADNGTNLDTDWNPFVSQSRYHQMLERIQDGIADLYALGYRVEIAGFFWMQGESDAKNDIYMARNYQINLTNFIYKLRRDLSYPMLPFVYGAIALSNDRTTDFGTFDYADLVRDAQLQVNQKVSYTRLVETSHFSKHTDNLHFDSPALITLGNLFANAWLKEQCILPCSNESLPDWAMVNPLLPFETVNSLGIQCKEDISNVSN